MTVGRGHLEELSLISREWRREEGMKPHSPIGWHGNLLFVVTGVLATPRLHSLMFWVGLGMESNTQFTLQTKATALWGFFSPL